MPKHELKISNPVQNINFKQEIKNEIMDSIKTKIDREKIGYKEDLSEVKQKMHDNLYIGNYKGFANIYLDTRDPLIDVKINAFSNALEKVRSKGFELKNIDIYCPKENDFKLGLAYPKSITENNDVIILGDDACSFTDPDVLITVGGEIYENSAKDKISMEKRLEASLIHEIGHLIHTEQATKKLGFDLCLLNCGMRDIQGDYLLGKALGISEKALCEGVRNKDLEFFHKGFKKFKKIANEISEYAKSNPSEFVAETFTKRVLNMHVSKQVLDLYKGLRGPNSKKMR